MCVEETIVAVTPNGVESRHIKNLKQELKQSERLQDRSMQSINRKSKKFYL